MLGTLIVGPARRYNTHMSSLRMMKVYFASEEELRLVRRAAAAAGRKGSRAARHVLVRWAREVLEEEEGEGTPPAQG